MNSVVKIQGVEKKYGEQIAVDNVNVDIKRGDIYGLIGRNGAGKTTLIRMIVGLVKPTNGTITVLGASSGHEYQEALKHTGSIIEGPCAYDNLTAEENLKYYCIQQGISDKSIIKKTLELVNLADTGKKKYKNFSLGMKQRLGIAIAILNKPDFIILDEPINGLDPIAIIEFRELLLKLNKQYNMTILISSHILSELYQVANRFGIINDGKMIKEISKEEFDLECEESISIKTDDVEKAAMILKTEFAADVKVVSKEEIRIYDYTGDISEINFALAKNEIRVHNLEKMSADLEEYFKKIVQG